MATNNFLYWSDGLEGRAFDHHRRNGGGAFANKNCPQGQAFEQFFQMPGVYPGVCPGGGMLAAGVDSHISHEENVVFYKTISSEY